MYINICTFLISSFGMMFFHMFSLFQTLIDICKGLPETNIASLVFALASSVMLIIVKELNTRYRHKIPYPIPIEIIVVSE